MNITEKKALQWLEKQGCTQLVFGYRASPDFICPDGSGFEIKKSRNHVIYFGVKQFEKLKEAKNTTILVFNDGDEPIAQFPFDEISDGKKQWGNIRIRIQHVNGRLIRINQAALEELDKRRTGKLSYSQIILEWANRKRSLFDRIFFNVS